MARLVLWVQNLSLSVPDPGFDQRGHLQRKEPPRTMVSEYKRSRDYELMVIFHPELSEEDVAGESDRVQGFLTTAEASITHVNRDAPWGRRRLAYPIRHGGRDLRDGIYALYYFTAEPGRIEDMEREIKLTDRIIRYLLTQQIAPIAEPEAPAGEEGAEQGAEGDAPAAPSTEASSEQAEPAPAEAAPKADPVVAEPAEKAEVHKPEAPGATDDSASDPAAVETQESEPVSNESDSTEK